MQQVQHEAERKAPFHQPLTLKHRDESRCPSRRSSVSSSTGSIFSDLASVASFGSTATSFSVHSTGQSDWSGLDSDFDDDLGVHASLLGGAQSSHASTAHHHYGVPFPTLDLLKSRSTEASPGEFTSGTTAPQLGATSHDGFKVPPIDLPLLRRPLRRETLPSQTTLPLRSVGNTFGPLPSLSASHNAPAVARASSLQGRPVSQTDTSGIAHFTGNPRRTAADPQRTKPTLVRQENRRVDYVEQLVDITEQLIAFIWPTSRQPADAVTRTGKSTICLRYFIREVLRRSKTSHSTLQVALYYCFMIWKSGRLPALDGRRMFLSSLMLSFKYLQDRNFSTRAWSSISSLPPAEIKMIEMTFLKAIDYSLFIRNSDWQEWRMRVCYGMWHARQSAPCPWKSLLSGMLHYQKFGTPSMASPSALTATPSVTFDSPALIPTAGNNRGRRPGPRTGSGIITPPSSPSPEPLSLDTRMEGVVPTIARQEPPTATVQTARPATAIKVEPVDAQTITPTSSHCSWTGAEVPSVLKAPKMSPLTSPDSVLEEPSFHPSTALGRMVHATPSGSANLQMPNTGTETPRTSSCQPKPTDGKVDIFSPSTAYSDHENAPSMKEAAQVPTLREEYGWLEHNYCLVEDHEDLVSRRLEGRSAKSRSGTNVRRKRSIRTAAAGCEENSARAKMARHRRA